jgi:cold shock CspA family protein
MACVSLKASLQWPLRFEAPRIRRPEARFVIITVFQQGSVKMQASRWLIVFYVLAALFLVVAGGAFLVDPLGVLTYLHPQAEVAPSSEMLARQPGLGLILAALVSLVCILTPKRILLHLAVGLYLLGLVVNQGEAAFGAAAWLWLIPVVYLLPLLVPLLAPVVRFMPLPGGDREGGKVKWFNPNKGFGFIITDDGREVFVHFKAVRNGGRRSLRNGASVSFTTVQTERGEQADEVYIESDT